LVIPVALMASGRWRAIVGAAAAVAALTAITLAAFGPQTWRGFTAVGPTAREALDLNLVGDEKMLSVFAAARLLKADLALAYGIQLIAAVAACAGLWRLQRRCYRGDAEGPAMVAAALVASPFLLDYDLILLAIPMAWLTQRGLVTGFRPWEKTILACAFMLPAVARNLAGTIGIPLGPLVVMAVLVLVLRRGIAEGSCTAASTAAVPATI
jgi:alpha-1,2-mannosyltransferase